MVKCYLRPHVKSYARIQGFAYTSHTHTQRTHSIHAYNHFRIYFKLMENNVWARKVYKHSHVIHICYGVYQISLWVQAGGEEASFCFCTIRTLHNETTLLSTFHASPSKNQWIFTSSSENPKTCMQPANTIKLYARAICTYIHMEKCITL